MKRKDLQRIIGFATGSLFKEIQSISNHAVEICRSTGGKALELTCLKNVQIPLLWDLNMHATRHFAHTSIHLPSDLIYCNNDTSTRALGLLHEFCKENRKFLHLAVIHPDRIVDWEMINDFSEIIPVAIENMDIRKNKFRSVPEIENILSKYQNLKLVFDINHWISNDYSIRTAYEFLDLFENRIAEIHISGYHRYHDPLFQTNQIELIEVISKVPPAIPIIIESVVSVEEIQKEFNLISKHLH
ncbi:hypothetical protein ACFL16_01495 [Patescibacteria group bacterium]